MWHATVPRHLLRTQILWHATHKYPRWPWNTLWHATIERIAIQEKTANLIGNRQQTSRLRYQELRDARSVQTCEIR